MRKSFLPLAIAFVCLVIFILARYRQSSTNYIVSEPQSTNSFSRPVRIVSLAPNITEILFALGLGDRIVAVSSGSDYPPEADAKQKVGTFWQPNIEDIIASKPDLVVTLWFEQQKAAADTLNRLGYQVLSLKAEKVEELLTAIQKISAATSCRQRADEMSKISPTR